MNIYLCNKAITYACEVNTSNWNVNLDNFLHWNKAQKPELTRTGFQHVLRIWVLFEAE